MDLCDPCIKTSGCEDKESKELARRATEQVQAAMQSLEAVQRAPDDCQCREVFSLLRSFKH